MDVVTTSEADTLPEPSEPVLPCDVTLPPATVIRKGVKLSTLLHALELRGMVSVRRWNA